LLPPAASFLKIIPALRPSSALWPTKNF